MRKIKIIQFLALFMVLALCLSGCYWIREDIAALEEREGIAGRSMRNPIPLGEYGDIFSDDFDAHIRISEIVRGEQANDIINSNRISVMSAHANQEYLIVKLNVRVSSISTGQTFSPRFLMILCDNGTLVMPQFLSADQIYRQFGMKRIEDITFEAEGSAEGLAIFLIDEGQERLLIYSGERIYFELN